MKNHWLRNLALTAAITASATTNAQVPQQNLTGASSFPVAQGLNQLPALPTVPQAQYQPGPNPQQVQYSVPQAQIPTPQMQYQQQMVGAQAQFVAGSMQAANYQLTGNQEAVSVPPPQPVPEPMLQQSAPMAHQSVAPSAAPAVVNAQPGCVGCAQNGTYSQPMSVQGAYMTGSPGIVSGGVSNQAYCGTDSGFGTAVPSASLSYTAASPVGHGSFLHAGHSRPLAGLGMPAHTSRYFFGANALLFNRVDDAPRPLAIFDATGATALSTRDARIGMTPGFEVFGGTYFNCGRNALVGSYWGIFSGTEMAQVDSTVAGSFRSRIVSTGDTQMPIDPTGATTPYGVYDWYDNGFTQRVRRSYDVQNVEVNILSFGVAGAARNFNRQGRGSIFSGLGRHRACYSCGGAGCGACGGAQVACGCGGAGCGSCTSGGFGGCGAGRLGTGPTGYLGPACGSRLNLSLMMGIRYFRFEDYLEYASSFNNDGINRTVDDIYYENNITNRLVGFQVGGRGDYCLGRRINLFGSGKIGVYGNHASLYSRLYNDFGTAYEWGVPANEFSVRSSTTEVAFLSELNAGFGYRITPKWSATFGYRAIIASGIATAVGNVRHPDDTVADQAIIDNRDVLILHGFTIGANYNF